MTTYERLTDERGRFTELEPLGVIDIGSNSVRLVVYEGAVRATTPLFNEKVLAGLGRTVATTGKLGKDAVQKALDALSRFHAVTRVLGVKNMRAIATAAVREASDGRDFISAGERILGMKIEILSGEKEAELAAHGIRMGFRAPNGIAGDLGGGSLELIDIEGDKLNKASTLAVGGLRLIDESGDRLDKATGLVDDRLSTLSWLSKGRGRTFFAVGGTWRALAKVHMERARYPLRVMHGYSVEPRAMMAFSEEIRKSRKLSAFPGTEHISRQRREVLPYGALVMERLLKKLEPSEVVFSVFGIREGLVYSLLPAHERLKDPLLSFCEDYARLRSRSFEHAVELCAWTDALFEGDGPKETDDERRLRHAACLLSDIAWRAHPDYRGEQSLNLIAHAGLSGIDHPGRIFLALAVYYRHIGADEGDAGDLSTRLTTLVTRRLQKRARIVGAAIRTAHLLSIGMPGVIDEMKLIYEGDKLVLRIPAAYAGLEGERLSRRFEALAGLVERRPELRVEHAQR